MSTATSRVFRFYVTGGLPFGLSALCLAIGSKPVKIRIDRSESFPAIGLSVAQARRILASVPAEWRADLDEVHISGSLVPSNSRCTPGDASFNPYDRRLTIFARGVTCHQLVAPILSALAAHHMGFSFRRGNRLSEADAQRLSHIIAPHVEHIIADGCDHNKPL